MLQYKLFLPSSTGCKVTTEKELSVQHELSQSKHAVGIVFKSVDASVAVHARSGCKYRYVRHWLEHMWRGRVIYYGTSLLSTSWRDFKLKLTVVLLDSFFKFEY